MARLIAEIGVNHNGSYEQAKKLIDIASESNCWGVKFQYRDIKNYFREQKLNSELGKEIIDIEIKKNYLSPNEIKKLSLYAKKLYLNVGISFFSTEDIKSFSNFEFNFYKVPSACSDNFELIRKLKSFNKFLMVSFGGKNYDEIKKIVKSCKLDNKNVTLFHCISNYPVLESNSNLGFIDTLKKKYKKCDIGYSSHEEDIHNCILCLTKKVSYIERHITLNKKGKGLDHSSSSDLKELKKFQSFNENLHKIYFDKSKFLVNQGEVLNKQNLGMSYYFKKNLKKNSILKKENLKLSYPNVGISDINIENFLNKKISRNIKKNEPLNESCFQNNKITKKTILKLNKYSFSVPIRPRDYKVICSHIPIANYELHMSFLDLKNFKINQFSNKFLKNNKFSIHMPDYCDSTNILDILSDEEQIRKKSNILLRKTLKIAKKIKKISKKDVCIIISLSKLTFRQNKFVYYRKIKKFIEKIKKEQKINIYPQWLTAKAWYFGGSYDTNAFSDPRDLSFLKKIKLPICFDTSHFILSCNFYKLNPDIYFKEIHSVIKHYHFSDAKGIDHEGILFGQGKLSKLKMLSLILKDKKTPKVLETWQGHLNDCLNFKKDISKLDHFIN